MTEGKPNRRSELEAVCAALRKAEEKTPKDELRDLLERTSEARARGETPSGADTALLARLIQEVDILAIARACIGPSRKRKRA
jgi:hypothetical protein